MLTKGGCSFPPPVSSLWAELSQRLLAVALYKSQRHERGGNLLIEPSERKPAIAFPKMFHE